MPRESSSDGDKKSTPSPFSSGFFLYGLFFLFLFTSLSPNFVSASLSELATAVEVNLVSVRSLQKINALFDLRGSHIKLHFSGLKCLVSVLTAKYS